MDVFSEVRQFQLDPNAHLRYDDYKEVAMSQEEFAEAMMKLLPPEKRIKDLSPEERLKGLSPEQRIEGLSPEDRLKGLSPEAEEQMLRLLQRSKRNKES